MIAAKYQAYKESGIPWIGSLPAHWETVPYKHLVDIQNGADHKHIEQAEGYPVIGSGGVFANASEFIYEGDSVLLGRKGTIDKPLFVSGRFWTVDTMYWTKIAQDANPRFAYYTALTIPFDYYATNTALPSMTKSVLHAHLVARPPKLEQAAIAAFLDRETAKIDSLVEEQRRLIELLKEKRQAVISRAVTKGLNPNVSMKDSGVEWLGKVPAHWQPIQLGRVCRQVSDGPHFSPQYVDDGVMFLSARNLGVDSWHLEDAKFVSEVDYLEFSKRVIPELGDVLYTKGGTTGIARVVDLPMRFQVWVHIAVLKLDRTKSDPYFMAYALNSVGCHEQSQLSTRGATNQDLGLTRMIRIWFALPPLTEQRVIAAWLSSETHRIDALVVESEAALSLLQERRAALISAAVTGKIDVRDSTDLLAAWAETKADIAAGRFVSESAKAHVARARAMAKRDD